MLQRRKQDLLFQLEARHTGLSDNDSGATNLKLVADVRGSLCQSFKGQVLPEQPKGEVIAAQLRLPVVVVLTRIDVGSPVWPTVCTLVGLPVAIEIQSPQHYLSVDRPFKDASGHHLPIDFDVLWLGGVGRYDLHYGLLLIVDRGSIGAWIYEYLNDAWSVQMHSPFQSILKRGFIRYGTTGHAKVVRRWRRWIS